MPVGKVLDEVEPEAYQPVLVRDDQMLHFTCDNAIHQSDELLSLEVHPAANLLDPIVNRDSRPKAIRLHCFDLRGEIILLSVT